MGKNKQLTLECTIKCSGCGHIHQTVITEKKLIQVPVIISAGAKSLKTNVELHPDEELMVGQEVIVDEQDLRITSLESSGKRIEHATAKEVSTLWTKQLEENGKVKVNISVHKGPNTLSHNIEALPDEEFYVGDILRIARDNVAIFKIKTQNRIIKYDGAAARDIIRIYGRVIR